MITIIYLDSYIKRENEFDVTLFFLGLGADIGILLGVMLLCSIISKLGSVIFG